MKKITTIALLILSMSCTGQNTTITPSCCDSNGAYTTAVYFDGVPNSNPNQYESKLAIDTTNNELYTYKNGWEKVGEGYSIITGIIYWTGSKWDLLDNSDHTTIGIDSVSTSNGLIKIHYSDTYDTVIYGAQIPDETLTSYGVTMGGSYGLSSSDISVYISKPYESWVTCYYNNGEWSVSHAHGDAYTNPNLISWDTSTSILTVGHNDFLDPVTDVKTLGLNFRAIEYNNTYHYDKTRLALIDFAGETYKPSSGDGFMFKLSGRYSDNNTYRGALNRVRIIDYSFLPASGGGVFTNFQILFIAK